MKLLVLGGTRFLGPAIVEAALAARHEVTLFNRGRTAPHLFPDLETLIGDRNEDLSALEGRAFDVVIDTCGYLPWQLERSARLLAPAVAQYLFVSTVSVYADESVPGLSERSPLARLSDEEHDRVDALTLADVTGTTYGPLKALCERAVERAMPGRATAVRPGLIVGPRDPTQRFRYWPWRFARGGDVLLPGPADAPQQWIDVRDLGSFIVRLAEDGHVGAFNAVGPGAPVPMEELLYGVKSVTAVASAPTWVEEAFLVERGLGLWSLPLWVPSADPRSRGFNRVSNAHAVAHGLAFRPLADTARATLLDFDARGERESWPFGLALLEREAALLREWRA